MYEKIKNNYYVKQGIYIIILFLIAVLPIIITPNRINDEIFPTLFFILIYLFVIILINQNHLKEIIITNEKIIFNCRKEPKIYSKEGIESINLEIIPKLKCRTLYYNLVFNINFKKPVIAPDKIYNVPILDKIETSVDNMDFLQEIALKSKLLPNFSYKVNSESGTVIRDFDNLFINGVKKNIYLQSYNYFRESMLKIINNPSKSFIERVCARIFIMFPVIAIVLIVGMFLILVSGIT